MPAIFLFFKNLASTSKVRFLIGFFTLIIFQIWSTYNGEGIAKTFDSLAYLKAAKSLVLYHNFPTSYVTWALGFPFLVILFKDSVFLNLICILGIYVFYFDLIQQLFQKKIIKWWLVLAFVFSTPLYLIHHFLWSEPPFLLFLIGSSWAFYYLNKSIIENQIAFKKLFLFSLFGFLFMSMRNSGFYFLVAISSGITFIYIIPSFLKIRTFKLSSIYQSFYFKTVVSFSFSALSSLFLWWLHTKPKTAGTFSTMYSLAERTFLEECFNYGDILSRWLVPPSIPLEIRIFLLVAFAILFITVFYNYLFYKEELNKDKTFILFIFWITSFYFVGMLISRAGMKVDAERYLAVLYPFLCILIGFALEKMKARRDYLKYGIAFLWLLYPFLRTLKNIIFWNEIV